jgi:cytochrome c peroxidase
MGPELFLGSAAILHRLRFGIRVFTRSKAESPGRQQSVRRIERNRCVDATPGALALAAYVRTIQTGDSPYDRYTTGTRSALSASARRGLDIFHGKGGCTGCHVGPTFSDEDFHNTGVAWRTGVLTDEGRARVTRAVADRGAFKTPTLREVARTAPYMHDGSFATLTEVVAFYNRGGAPNPGLDRQLRPLNLNEADKQDLETFLRSLSGKTRDGE